MPSRTLPGILLEGYAPFGEANWDDWMNPNLLKLSVLVQLSVQSRTTILPGSPTAGDKYIVPVGSTNENEIAVFDDGEWVYYPPKVGTLAYIEDTEVFYYWDNTAWTLLATGGGGGGASATLTENPQTGTSYTLVLSDAPDVVVSLNNAADITLTVPTNASVAFPVGSYITVWQKGAGQVRIVGAVGVAVETPAPATEYLRGQNSFVTLYKSADNTWQLFGDLALSVGPLSASEVSVDSAGSIAAGDVQSALEELDAEKVSKSGDTMTGGLFVNARSSDLAAISGDVDDSIAGAKPCAQLTRYVDGTQAAFFFARKARGTKETPTAVLSGDFIGGFRALGYHGTAFTAGNAGGAFLFSATENWALGDYGTAFDVYVNRNGAGGNFLAFRMDQDGSMKMGTALDTVITPERLFRTRVLTVSGLSALVGVAAGDGCSVSDSSSSTPGVIVSGGGINFVDVRFDGFNWRIV